MHDPAHAVFIISKIYFSMYQAYSHFEFFNASCISAEAHCRSTGKPKSYKWRYGESFSIKLLILLLHFPNRLISSLFLKYPRRSPTRGERSLPGFFVYLIYVESRREASGCILPLTIIIIPPPSRRRRRQQPSLPPRRQPSRTSSLAVGPRRGDGGRDPRKATAGIPTPFAHSRRRQNSMGGRGGG